MRRIEHLSHGSTSRDSPDNQPELRLLLRI
jgi:hypothetical protein